MVNVALVRIIVEPVLRAKDIVGLRISPEGMVEEKDKRKAIHDLIVCGASCRLTIRLQAGNYRRW